MKKQGAIISINIEGEVTYKKVKTDSFSIGRSSKDNVSVRHAKMSRGHLKVKLNDENIFIRDDGSTNGTMINMKKIPRKEWFKIESTDEIGIGEPEIILKIESLSTAKGDMGENTVVIEMPKKTSAAFFPSSTLRPEVTASNFHNSPVQTQMRPVAQVQEVTQEEVQEEVQASINDAESGILVEEANPEVDEMVKKALEEVDSSNFELSELERNRIEIENKMFTAKLHQAAKARAAQILAESRSKLQENEEKLKTIEDELEQKKSVLEEKYEEREKALEAGHSEKIDKLQSEIDEYHERLSCIKEEKEKLSENCLELEREVRSLSHEADRASDRLKDLERKEDEVKEIIEKYRTQEDQCITSIDRLKDEMSSYQRQTRLLSDELTTLKEREERANKRVDELNQSIEEYSHKRLEEEQELRELREQVDRARDEKKILDESIELLRLNHEEIKKQLEDKKDRSLKELEAELNKRREKVELEHRERKNELMFELKDLRASHESKLESELERLESQKVAHQKNIEDLAQERERILTESKAKAEEIVEHARSQAENTQSQSQAKADQILGQAKEEAIQKIRSAEEKENQIIERSEKVLADASDKAQKIIDSAISDSKSKKEEIEEIISGLTEQQNTMQASVAELEEKISQLNSNYEQRVLEQEQEYEALTVAKEDELKKLHDLREAEYLESYNLKIEELQEEFKTKHEVLHAEYEKQKREDLEALARMRAKEVENIRAMRKKEQDEIEKRKDDNINLIVNGIEVLVNTEIQKQLDADSKKSDLKVASKLIKQLVKESLTTEANDPKPLLDRLNPYGLYKKGHSLVRMKQVAIAGIVVGVLLLTHLIFPRFYPYLGSSVSELFAVENTAQELFVSDLHHQREIMMNFSPEMSPEFKETLTDNVLYTENFVDTWLSDRFRNQWAVKLDELIVLELELSEAALMNYIRAETRLVRELAELRRIITNVNKDEQIASMKDLESRYYFQFLDILEGQENLNRVERAQEIFFNNFN